MPVMSTAAPLITAEELLHMRGDQRREMVKGELRIMAPAGFDHGAVIDNVQVLLSVHVRKDKLGRVVGGETGFKLTEDPDTVRNAASDTAANRRTGSR